MALPDLTYSKKSNLSDSFDTVRRKFTQEEYTKTALNYRTFYYTSTFLPVIWKRILQNAKLEEEYYEISYKYSDPDEKRIPTAEEAKKLSEYNRIGRIKNMLDTEDWFLHARILMDKYSLFSHELNRLIQRKKNQATINGIENKSFNDYLKSYTSNYNQLINKEYADILIANSQWFPELKDVRDTLITHEKSGKMWVGGSNRGLPRFGKLRLTETHKIQLKKIKTRYQDDFPKLKEITSYPMMLRFFEENYPVLHEKDQNRIVQIRQSHGRMFPNIPTLFQNMTAFFEKTNVYFTKELETYPDLPRRRKKWS